MVKPKSNLRWEYSGTCNSGCAGRISVVERTSGHVCQKVGINVGGVMTWEDEKRLPSNLPRGARNQQQSALEVRSVYGTKACR